jgi:hypothetical protein
MAVYESDPPLPGDATCANSALAACISAAFAAFGRIVSRNESKAVLNIGFRRFS